MVDHVKKFGRNEDGAIAVESVLWFPVYATVAALLVDATSLVLTQTRMQQAAADAARMVAIGRAVMSKPKLLLLDEPSGGLSPQFVNEIGVIIKALKNDGATILMVEQNLSLAFKVADRFIILRDGLVSDGGFVKGMENDHDEIVKTIYL